MIHICPDEINAAMSVIPVYGTHIVPFFHHVAERARRIIPWWLNPAWELMSIEYLDFHYKQTYRHVSTGMLRSRLLPV